jgi:hypothetical protein
LSVCSGVEKKEGTAKEGHDDEGYGMHPALSDILEGSYSAYSKKIDHLIARL